MLSIRTQNRFGIIPYNKPISTNFYNNDRCQIMIGTKENQVLLGTYATKERALEVLDEIEDYTKRGKEQRYDSQGLIIETSGEWCYRMPKE